ncbi:uncharacterized protein A4U43_UnF660 [Asparagus officinalis]|uniref:Uncharacterized protein n=1 Tax=Asparagus officinalis TaxID=4686 RepID=A0A1R3L7N8_ASPOF|nr:uncharacterized protein A4U43_UnF660 [Asparagus officinalis]
MERTHHATITPPNLQSPTPRKNLKKPSTILRPHWLSSTSILSPRLIRQRRPSNSHCQPALRPTIQTPRPSARRPPAAKAQAKPGPAAKHGDYCRASAPPTRGPLLQGTDGCGTSKTAQKLAWPTAGADTRTTGLFYTVWRPRRLRPSAVASPPQTLVLSLHRNQHLGLRRRLDGAAPARPSPASSSSLASSPSS